MYESRTDIYRMFSIRSLLYRKLLIIAERGGAEEVVTRLARVGYDHTIVYLEGGIDAWIKAGKETDTMETISVSQLADQLKHTSSSHVIDMRKQDEYEAEHLAGSRNLLLDDIN